MLTIKTDISDRLDTVTKQYYGTARKDLMLYIMFVNNNVAYSDWLSLIHI